MEEILKVRQGLLKGFKMDKDLGNVVTAVNKHKPRPNINQYFMNISEQVATRSTCDRKNVGVVIVRNQTILSTGYNGAPKGLPHCSDSGIGHMMKNDHCIRTTHAEANAIVQAAKNGVCIDKATLYTNVSPCWNCLKLIINAGIVRIIFGEPYGDDTIYQFAKEAEIKLDYIKDVI